MLIKSIRFCNVEPNPNLFKYLYFNYYSVFCKVFEIRFDRTELNIELFYRALIHISSYMLINYDLKALRAKILSKNCRWNETTSGYCRPYMHSLMLTLCRSEVQFDRTEPNSIELIRF